MATRRTWALIALASGTALLAFLAPRGAEEVSSAGAGATAPAKSGPGIPAGLPERRPLAAPKRDLFGLPPAPPAPPASPLPQQLAPAPPPAPYHFAGTSSQGGQGGKVTVWLGVDNRVYEARAGEMLDEVWRVKSVSRDAVVLLHVALNVEQRMERPGADLPR
jgi:hypothetical protein